MVILAHHKRVRKSKDKTIEASRDHEESHFGTMSDDFTGVHDMKEIEAQELACEPLQNSKRVRKSPLRLDDMACLLLMTP